MEIEETEEVTRTCVWSFRTVSFGGKKQTNEKLGEHFLSSQGTDFWSLYELLPKLFSFKCFYFNFSNLIGMTKEERVVEANILQDC